MTDDITRGLALLADEVSPATIDSHAVVAQARARTRNRRTTVTAFVAVVLVGVLVAVLNAARPDDHEVATIPKNRSERLTMQLADAAPGLIPASWRPTKPFTLYDGDKLPPRPPLVFGCASDLAVSGTPDNETDLMLLPGNNSCRATAFYRDTEGRFILSITVSNAGSGISCGFDCVPTELGDGTDVIMDDPAVFGQRGLQMNASRPDGTYVTVHVVAEKTRAKPLMTTDELLKFATAFTY